MEFNGNLHAHASKVLSKVPVRIFPVFASILKIDLLLNELHFSALCLSSSDS